MTDEITWEEVEQFVKPEGQEDTYNMEFTPLQEKFLTHFWRIMPRKERARIGNKLFPGLKYSTLAHYVGTWELDGRIECKR